MAALRADLVFSYWIYLWYILYIFKIISYSPKFALILGLIDNIIMLFLMFMFGTSKKTIFYFIIINTLIKIIPLYTLIHEKIKMIDILFTFFLSLLFVIWIHMNSQTLIGNMKLVHDSLLYGKNETPFLSLMNKIERNFIDLKII
jgi:hypothetical protein